MTVTIEPEILIWLTKNDLWALVENKQPFLVGEDALFWLKDVKKTDLIEAPEALNVRKSVYYVVFKSGMVVWYILLKKITEDWYMVVRIISSCEKDANYFYQRS